MLCKDILRFNNSSKMWVEYRDCIMKILMKEVGYFRLTLCNTTFCTHVEPQTSTFVLSQDQYVLTEVE